MTEGSVSQRRVFAEFAARAADQPLARYGGRPDGAAVPCRIALNTIQKRSWLLWSIGRTTGLLHFQIRI